NCSKISDTFPGWVVPQDGFFDLRRYPHLTSRPILLKMNFIQRPNVNIVIGHQPTDFFLKAFCASSSARAIKERGFLKRKPKSPKSLWHCRTPNLIPNS